MTWAARTRFRYSTPPPPSEGFSPLETLDLTALSNGNRTLAGRNPSAGSRSAAKKASGKWYAELLCTSTNQDMFILSNGPTSLSNSTLNDLGAGLDYRNWHSEGGTIWSQGSGPLQSGSYGDHSWVAGNRVGVSIDFSTMEMKFWRNGSARYTSTMSAGTYRIQLNAFIGSVHTFTDAPVHLPSGFQAWI